MDKSYDYTVRMETIACGECQIPHSMPKALLDKHKENGTSWFCPSGHYIGFNDSKVEKLETKIEALENSLKSKKKSLEYYREEARSQSSRAAAYKGHFTKLKNKLEIEESL